MFSIEKIQKERYVGNDSPYNFSNVIVRVIGENQNDYTFKIC